MTLGLTPSQRAAVERWPAERRAETAAAWRARADRLDRYAAGRRREGDTTEAMDSEQAALDWRVAADELAP